MHGCEYQFFINNSQAADWYDPPKAYAITEYEWVLQNVHIAGQVVLDVGAHHGHYSMLFANADSPAARIHAVEPLASNNVIIKVNAALNQVKIDVHQGAISTSMGTSLLVPRSNARLHPKLGISTPTFTLANIAADASIVKLDIEGEEFNILPEQIDTMSNVHTWIIEFHPRYGNSSDVAMEFLKRGFEAFYVNRELNSVVIYKPGVSEIGATTMFFQVNK
jgi:FkbM family methyltransferase